MARAKKFDSKRFLDRVGKKLAKAAQLHSRPHIRSKTLRGHATVVNRKTTNKMSVWAVSIPHYWAVYRNDGTRGSVAKKGKMLFIFKDRHLDPRTSFGKDYAKRLTNRPKHKMSKSQMRAAIKKGDLIITKKVGPSAGEHFFDNDGGMLGFKSKSNIIVKKEVSKEVKKFLGDDLKMKVGSTVFF